jgi:hypothetical protein
MVLFAFTAILVLYIRKSKGDKAAPMALDKIITTIILSDSVGLHPSNLHLL